MSNKDISEGAQQLFSYMVHNRIEVFKGEGSRIEITFSTSDQFVNDYKLYLEELHKAKWIICRERSSILLGYGTIQHDLFHQEASDEQIIQMYRSRYSERECTLIDQVFTLCASDRKGRPLTSLMQIAEYEYYTRYSVAQVLKGCQTFLALPPEKPKAARYLRGIIRGEAERNPTMQQQAVAPIVAPEEKKVTHKPSSSHELRKLKSGWVNSQIALKEQWYNSLSLEEQASFISDLELQFDVGHTSV